MSDACVRLGQLLDFDSSGLIEIDSLVTVLKTSTKVAPGPVAQRSSSLGAAL